MIVTLVQGLTLGMSAAATPGPLQFFLISRSMSHGWRRALPAAAGPLISDAVIVPAVLFLLTRLPDLFLNVIQIIGALFILYLAWEAFQVFRKNELLDRETIAGSDAARQSLVKAIGINFLSPNPYVAWGTIMGPIVLRAWAESPGLAITFVVGFYVAMIGLNAALIILFGRAGDLGPRVARTVLGIATVALVLLGIYQLWTGINLLLQRA